MTVITYRGATVLEFDDKENSPLDKLFVVKLGTSPLELENPEDRAKILAAVKSTEKERKLNHLEKMREDKGGGGLQLPPPVRLTPSVDSEEDWVDPAQLTSLISLRLLAEHAWCEDLRLSAEQAAARGRVTPRPASDVVSPGSPGGKKRERS